MQFKGRSLYNLLQVSVEEDSSIEVEPWQVLDYRAFSEGELFSKLESLNVNLNKEEFLLYGENMETPEELCDHLWLQEEYVDEEQKLYLLIFELWRRLLPLKESLSIFFDSLDQIIAEFDAGEMIDEEITQQKLYHLQDILDRGIDGGLSSSEVLGSISEYTAHDIEGFLYDYITELLEEGSEIQGSKLTDAFAPYVKDEKWFSLLRVRFFALSNEQRAITLLDNLLEEEPQFAFLSEVCSFLAYRGGFAEFSKCVRQTLQVVEEEEQLQEIVLLIVEFYRCLDKEPLEKACLELLERRKSLDAQSSITENDRNVVEELLFTKALSV
jgi:hypothetical protein